MKLSHSLTHISWTGIAAAAFAIALAAGCERNTSLESAGQKVDRAAESAGQKMDQAAADIKQKADKAGDTMGDAAITAKVKTAMVREPDLKATQINVDTANGVVTLTGSVDTPQNIERAMQVAQAVEGVKSVNNQLSVKSQG